MTRHTEPHIRRAVPPCGLPMLSAAMSNSLDRRHLIERFRLAPPYLTVLKAVASARGVWTSMRALAHGGQRMIGIGRITVGAQPDLGRDRGQTA
jgi:hypothetical protein